MTAGRSDCAAKNPYIARQEAIEEAIRHALAQERGIRACGAPTGSGKNYVAARVIARMLIENRWAWDDDEGRVARPDIVASLPMRANRSSFAGEIVRAIVEESRGEIGMADAERMVVELPSLSDGLVAYLDRVGAAAVRCPLRADTAKENKEIEDAWSAAVEAHANLRRFGGEGGSMLEALTRMMGSAEWELRGHVRTLYANTRRNADGPRLIAGMPVVPEIWPAVRLAERGPKAIVATPNKLMAQIDTFTDGSLSLVSADFAKHAVYLFDEIDRAKIEMTKAIITNRAVDYQPDDLVRILVAHFLEDAESTSPLLKGDVEAWRRVWFAASSGKHAGSLANKGKYPVSRVDAAAGRIAKRFRKMFSSLLAVHEELRLEFPFRTEGELAEEGKDVNRLFSGDDGVQLLGRRGRSKVYAVADEGRKRNALLTEKDSAAAGGRMELAAMLGRCNGAIRSALSLLALCARTHSKMFEGDPTHSRDDSIKTIVDAAGFHNDQNGDQEIWKSLIGDRLLSQDAHARGKTEDTTVYSKGASYCRIEDAEAHELTTYVTTDLVPYLPEAVFAAIAGNAPVCVMSATWGAPTVKNLNYAYLGDVKGVVPKDGEMDGLNDDIAAETRKLNERIRGEYEVSSRAVRADAAVVRLADLVEGGVVGSPDEIQRAALASFCPVCASEADAERCVTAADDLASSGRAAAAVEKARARGDLPSILAVIEKYPAVGRRTCELRVASASSLGNSKALDGVVGAGLAAILSESGAVEAGPVLDVLRRWGFESSGMRIWLGGDFLLDAGGDGRGIDVGELGADWCAPCSAVSEARSIDVRGCRGVVVVENLAAWRQSVRDLGKAAIFLYADGALAGEREDALRSLLALCPERFPPFAWNDVDAAGFQRFDALERDFPEARPLFMGCDTLAAMPDRRLRLMKESQRAVLGKYLEGNPGSRFAAVSGALLSRGRFLEQEALLDGYAQEGLRALLDRLPRRGGGDQSALQ